MYAGLDTPDSVSREEKECVKHERDESYPYRFSSVRRELWDGNDCREHEYTIEGSSYVDGSSRVCPLR